MMEKIKQLIKRKPMSILLYTGVYLVILGFLHWKLKPDITIAYYLAGGLLGIYFMDIAELIFDIKPSPFHSIVFLALFAVVSFFVVTSSGNMFAIGLVLSLFFNLLLAQVSEWMTRHDLSSWFTMVASPVSPRMQFWIMVVTAFVLIFESVIFIR
jgi:hypothetical protein